MIRAVIIEDEKRNTSLLKTLLKEYCPDVIVIGDAGDVAAGIELIRKETPALVFLDIELPDGTAFDMLEKIPERIFHIIFTTAYDHYAIKAIKFSALDYLLKPINFLELKDAVEKAKSKEVDSSSINNISILLKNLSSHAVNTPEKIALPTSEGHIFVNVEDIIRFEADGNYTMAYLTGKEKLLMSRTLKDFELFLNENDFVRVHHSDIISVRHIKKYVKGKGGYIVMSDGAKVEVSSRKKEDFLRKMNIR